MGENGKREKVEAWASSEAGALQMKEAAERAKKAAAQVLADARVDPEAMRQPMTPNLSLWDDDGEMRRPENMGEANITDEHRRRAMRLLEEHSLIDSKFRTDGKYDVRASFDAQVAAVARALAEAEVIGSARAAPGCKFCGKRVVSVFELDTGAFPAAKICATCEEWHVPVDGNDPCVSLTTILGKA